MTLLRVLAACALATLIAIFKFKNDNNVERRGQ